MDRVIKNMLPEKFEFKIPFTKKHFIQFSYKEKSGISTKLQLLK